MITRSRTVPSFRSLHPAATSRSPPHCLRSTLRRRTTAPERGRSWLDASLHPLFHHLRVAAVSEQPLSLSPCHQRVKLQRPLSLISFGAATTRMLRRAKSRILREESQIRRPLPGALGEIEIFAKPEGVVDLHQWCVPYVEQEYDDGESENGNGIESDDPGR
ncbi:phage tail protein [Sesbania bispinosa]|nr:phage tail protein [Sesbania bispinosa]